MAKEPLAPTEDVFELMLLLEKLKQPAIDKLLEERAEIDKKLAQLGYKDEEPPVEEEQPARPRGRAKGSSMSEEHKARIAAGQKARREREALAKAQQEA